MVKTTLIMYSHTSCSDLWDMFCGQVEKYLSVERKVVFTDETDWSRDGWDVITYDDSWSFPGKVSRCLDQVDTETCMFHLEDMPLYNTPDESKLSLLEDSVRTTAIDYVKLIRGIDPLTPTWIPGVYRIPMDSPYLFAIQPSIWKTKRLKELFDRCLVDFDGNTARGFEPFAQKPAKDMSLFGTFTYDNEPQVGLGHFDSVVYPYVATAINAGKWNTSGYRKELDILFNEYNIDPSIRGEV